MKKFNYRRKKKSTKLKSPILWVIILVVIIILGLLIYKAATKTNPVNNNSQPVTAKNGSASLPKSSSSSSNNTPAQGGAIDQNGQTNTTTTPTSQPTTSQSGFLTVDQPASGVTLKTGDTLSGTAQVSQVQFRLTDNVVGVVAQGSLNVVSGKFAGTLQFKTNGTSGRLDVFSLNPVTNAEINEVQIPVSF